MIADIIGNHRTVQSLANQEYLVEKHFKSKNQNYKNSLKQSLMYAFSIFWVYNYSLPMIYYMADCFETDSFRDDKGKNLILKININLDYSKYSFQIFSIFYLNLTAINN
jgi:hypothetical protein